MLAINLATTCNHPSLSASRIQQTVEESCILIMLVAADIAGAGYNTPALALKDSEKAFQDTAERGLTLTCGAEFYLKSR